MKGGCGARKRVNGIIGNRCAKTLLELAQYLFAACDSETRTGVGRTQPGEIFRVRVGGDDDGPAIFVAWRQEKSGEAVLIRGRV